ncbi:MAG: efflux RND transporter periplasmic adaptor subunit, partial [Methanomassiliicoccales archaeon]|nr:efflux RND transporter periplasmic adaptor subunit [Methanomassiliicoccales archaeon]
RRAVELDTPISGVVTALNVNAGDYAASEQTLATVASYGRIRIPLEVSETDRGLVQVGQPVRLRYGERQLEGQVVKVALSGDPSSRLFAIEVVIENGERLVKPGALVTPESLVARTDAKPVVPPDAIIKSDGEEHVFVVDQSGTASVAKLRQVVRGIDSGSMTAIDQGITPGDVVVVWGQSNLEDGVRVKIHEDLTAGTYKVTH